MTWTVSNNTSSPIAGTDLNLAFGVSGVTVAAGGSESADQVIVGPASAGGREQRVLWGVGVGGGDGAVLCLWVGECGGVCGVGDDDDGGVDDIDDGGALDDGAGDGRWWRRVWRCVTTTVVARR